MIAKPDFHHAYNALGYSLADRNVRLAEAKTLIEKAVELAPDDAYIQDSLGWVEFRMGNGSRALNILQAAYGKRRAAAGTSGSCRGRCSRASTDRSGPPPSRP
jgi:Flp pilus assembly protein TadD